MNDKHDEVVEKVREARIFKYGDRVAQVAAEMTEEFAVVVAMKAHAYEINRTALLRRSATAAEEGMKATIPLVARKGRASYLGERSAGHQDPGATSSWLLVKTVADTWAGD